MPSPDAYIAVDFLDEHFGLAFGCLDSFLEDLLLFELLRLTPVVVHQRFLHKIKNYQ